MAKTLKLTVPKRLAGIKIPRQVRKGTLGTFLNSTAGQIVLAECLLLIGGVLAAAAKPDSGPGKLLRNTVARGRDAFSSAGERAKNGQEIVRDRSGRLGSAFERAAEAFKAAMLEETAAHDADLAEDSTDDMKDVTPKRPLKKKRTSQRQAPH